MHKLSLHAQKNCGFNSKKMHKQKNLIEKYVLTVCIKTRTKKFYNFRIMTEKLVQTHYFPFKPLSFLT